MSNPFHDPQSVTIQNLEAAFAGESMAHIKYRYFAKLCRDMGDEETARHFEHTADQEVLHAFGHLDLLYPKGKMTPAKALHGEGASAGGDGDGKAHEHKPRWPQNDRVDFRSDSPRTPAMFYPQPARHARFRQTRVLIVGCGDVGRRVAAGLRPRCRVLALTSSPDKAASLRAWGIVPLLGNLDAPQGLARLAGLATRVLHLAPPPGAGASDPRTAPTELIIHGG